MIPATGAALLGLLVLGVPVAAALVLLALGLDLFASRFPLERALGEVLWGASDSFLLIAIPLFVLMGQILVRGGIAERTYRALEAWLGWLPGGLVHANIGTATLFSATSGSSVATAATVATVAMPQARRLGYDPRLFAGSIAAGGTLGILIPPSINLIVYGFLTETSIPRLFLAGLLPGLLLAVLFMATAALICTWRPELGGPRRPAAWRARLAGLADLVPVGALFVLVVGAIYTGWATPTEAAALGVAGALALAAAHGRCDRTMVAAALDATVRTTAMILLVVTAAYFLNFALAAAGVGQALTALLEGLPMGRWGVLAAVILLYVVLGFFIETLSLMVVTLPIVAPVMIGLGFDPVWFGVVMIVLVEMALITPPVGLNLYVVQGVRGDGRLEQVMLGALPFVGAMAVLIGLLIAMPGLALWLPATL